MGMDVVKVDKIAHALCCSEFVCRAYTFFGEKNGQDVAVFTLSAKQYPLTMAIVELDEDTIRIKSGKDLIKNIYQEYVHEFRYEKGVIKGGVAWE